MNIPSTFNTLHGLAIRPTPSNSRTFINTVQSNTGRQ